MTPEEFSPEQIKFLRDFSANYVTGRRIACRIAHALVALGGLATAITAIIVLISQLRGR